jgi:hypothetical protein
MSTILDMPTSRLGTADGNDSEHIDALLGALQRLDRLLEQAIAQAHAGRAPASEADPYRGLYISQEEVARLLSPEGSAPRAADRSCGGLAAADVPRMARLARAFGLCSLEIDLLLIALAPDLDRRYERLYAYLQDDMTRRRPTVDMALGLLCATARERLAARRHLDPRAPLLRYRLARLLDDPADHEPPLLGKYLAADERIVTYLLGEDAIDSRLEPYARLVTAPAQLDALVLPADMKRRLALLARGHGAGDSRLIVYLQGPYGIGKQTVAAALCGERGIGLLALDGERAARLDAAAFETLARLAAREAALQNAALYWDGYGALLAEERQLQRELLLGELARPGCPAFLAGDTAWEPSDAPDDLMFVRVEIPPPAAADRSRLWAQALGDLRPMDSDAGLAELAGTFRFTPGQIRDAAATARSLARWRNPERGQVSVADLAAACRLQSNRKLAELAEKIVPHYSWDEIVLPGDRLEQLREIRDSVRHRVRVYESWGFGAKLALGKGLNVLFAGPSGTGKTMAADILAGELGLDLYKIDLSAVVSKYIGETEKNLARIFAEAATSNVILFFDEADALFGKRSEVKDAHDRYANVEIAYLLQKMEAYDGIVILATNLRKNMDDAFVRRMHFTIEFPFPGDQDRRRIWEHVWPRALPRDPALDLDMLARRFEMAGGNIRNVALAAAFLAAADSGVVTMPHLLHATRREYQKMGKILAEQNFSLETERGTR